MIRLLINPIRIVSISLGILLLGYCQARAEWTAFQVHPRSSLRGIHALDQNHVWVCGSEGVIIRYSRTDESVVLGRIQGLEHSEFRSIHAWDLQTAIVATAGQPACIYKTSNGGQSWKEVHRSLHRQSFFNGMKFIDEKRGIVFGDPIDQKLEILTTLDAGETWSALHRDRCPELESGEAGFAASNSSMLISDGHVFIGLGGGMSGISRIVEANVDDCFRNSEGLVWKSRPISPIRRGESRGVFSLARSSQKVIAVGGDYKQVFEREGTIAISEDHGLEWRGSKAAGVRGFRSSIVYHDASRRWIAVGPTGTDISEDGETWAGFSEVGYHALFVAPDGTLWAAGSDGRLGQADAPKLQQTVVR